MSSAPLPLRVKGLLLLVAACLLLFPGCAGLVTAMYIKGELQTDYYAPIDRVWKACEKTTRDLRADDVVVDKEYRDGTIEATINGSKVVFSIAYKQKDITNVGIRVGIIGSEDSSRFLHDRIEENLK